MMADSSTSTTNDEQIPVKIAPAVTDVNDLNKPVSQNGAEEAAEIVAQIDELLNSTVQESKQEVTGETVKSTQDLLSLTLAPVNDEIAAAEPEIPATDHDDILLEEEPSQVETVDNNLIDIINSMEADRQKFIAHVRSKISNQETEFEKTKAENVRLKNRVAELEQCLRQNNISFGLTAAAAIGGHKGKKSNRTADEEDILAKAKTLLFEKTKICKQQEQQLTALRAQVDATKEVLQVTKEMLCLRNIEHDHSEARLDTMDLKLKNERARQVLNDKKLEVAKKMYADLRTEYDLQSNIFKQLRAGYEEKIKVLTKQVATLKS